MDKSFPTIPAGQPVPCFNCNAPLTGAHTLTGGHAISAHAPKYGQYRAYCTPCDMFTWFDKGQP